MCSHPCTALLIGLYLFSPMYCPSFYLWMIRTYSHSCTAHLEKSGTTQAYSLYKKEICHSLTQDRLLAVHGPWQACAYSQMGSRWPRIGSCKDEQYMREYGDSLFTRESTLRINSFAELDYIYMTGSKHKCNLYWLKWIQKYFHMISDINATLWWLVGEKWFEYRLACILWQALLSAHKITSLVLVRSLFTIYLTTTRRELSSG